MTKVFLDANVLFSAACGRSPGFARLWAATGITLVTSDLAAEQARRNLQQSGVVPHRLRDLLAGMLVVGTPSPETWGEDRAWSLPDADDVPILLSAIQARCDFLITGDNHFKAMFGQQVDGVMVLKSAAFLERL